MNTINQLDLVDIYRKQYPKTAKYTFFSRAHGTFTKIDHILGNETTFDIVISIQIIHSMFSYNDEIKLEINNRKIFEKSQNNWKLSNIPK